MKCDFQNNSNKYNDTKTKIRQQNDNKNMKIKKKNTKKL